MYNGIYQRMYVSEGVCSHPPPTHLGVLLGPQKVVAARLHGELVRAVEHALSVLTHLMEEKGQEGVIRVA